MGQISVYLGKGMREPCSPNRELIVFGGPLNPPGGNSWNCAPVIASPTTAYDLSTFTDYSEVCLGLVVVNNASVGVYHFRFSWFRLIDARLLTVHELDVNAKIGIWCYAFAYIGYVPWEIWDIGTYRLFVEVSGPDSGSFELTFEITAIPDRPPDYEPPPMVEPPVEPPPEVPLPSVFFNEIIAFFVLVRDHFYTVAEEVAGWVYPLNWLAVPFQWVGYSFDWLAYGFTLLRDWAIEVWSRVLTFLDANGVLQLLYTVINMAIDSWEWVSNAGWNILYEITYWWDYTIVEVQSLIEYARQWAEDQINNVYFALQPVYLWYLTRVQDLPTLDEIIPWFGDRFNEYWETIDEWWSSNYWQVEWLIDSAFTLRADLWAGWTDIKAEAVEFFTDPLEWLYNKLDEFFERFW